MALGRMTLTTFGVCSALRGNLARPLTAARRSVGWASRSNTSAARSSTSTALRAVMRPRDIETCARLVEATKTTEVVLVEKDSWEAFYSGLAEEAKTWVDVVWPTGWKAGATTVIPGAEVSVACCANGDMDDFGALRDAVAALPAALPKKRVYSVRRFDSAPLSEEAVVLGWSLGAYSFDRYKTVTPEKKAEDLADSAKLAWPMPAAGRVSVSAAVRATFMVRDLITTPAEDCGPADLEEATRELADGHEGALVTAVVGEKCLAADTYYPQVHAVGRAAAVGREPRVVQLEWGSEDDPLVYVLGKGVTFDTGGLNIKPGVAMLSMKKDMGGAASAIGLCEMVMAGNLKIRLRLLLACVENSIAGDSFRPGDILTARNGLTTEIGNTDAEGRLVLADLLVDADENDPALIIDLATLTGAGRVALGTDVPAMFSNVDDVASELQRLSSTVADDVWRLPLWAAYDKELDSPIADMKNIGNGPYGGAITAALYLQRFLKKAEEQTPWIHLDMMAYNPTPKPGRPVGGEAMGVRALFEFLKERYGAK